jgi:O-antigen/teichoic acid export membrane protein
MLFNFITFSTNIVDIIAWKEYLTSDFWLWADYILPFLAVVLFLSFIKQVFNYILVSFNKQNSILKVNLFGVIIWTVLWLYLIPRFDINGGIITQLVLELCFVSWIILFSRKNKILPTIQRKYILYSTILFIIFMIFFQNFKIPYENKILFVIYVIFVNMIYVWISYKFVKQMINKI